MAVNITWSLSDGGSAISQPVDHGSGANGSILTYKEIWVRHNGTNQITDCKFWLTEYSGTYSGGATAADDLAEMLGWGAGEAAGSPGDANGFGGFQVNMDKVNSFAASWPTFAVPGTVGSLAVAFKTAIGDSANNGVVLNANMSGSMSLAGVIPASCSPNPCFRARIQIPTSEGTGGQRQFDQKLRFTYTS